MKPIRAALLVATAMCATTGDGAPQSGGQAALLTRARAVLAQLKGEIPVPGLSAPVEVLRDQWGVAHIYAANADDLFFAQGFVAAQDRLFQLELWRRTAAGEMAEITGPQAVGRDRVARLLKYRGDMELEWASYAPDAKRIAAAFTGGINAYIDHAGKRLPVEFQILGVKPKKWQPSDLLGRTSLLGLVHNAAQEVQRAQLVSAVGLEAAREIMPTDPPAAFTPPERLDLAGIDETVLVDLNALEGAARLPRVEGSNNWVVDGTLSASGKPMLAGDPHRVLALPSLRYLVHLNAPGWNVIGAGEPALPGVAIGHNDRIAWAFTIVRTDQADLYVEETHAQDRNRYRAGDGWADMEVVRETIPVKGGPPAVVELCYTRHGPVIHEDRRRNRAFALRWVGGEPGSAAYLASLAVDRAGGWDAFKQALSRWRTPALNFVYADVEGNVGWLAAGLTPVRDGWRGLLPVPGASGEYRWRRFLTVDELPQLYNPSERFIATANHNILKMLPQGYSREIGYDWGPPYRYDRVRELLTARRGFTVADFQAMQHDVVSIPGRQLARLLERVGIEEGELLPLAAVLRGWDGSMTKDSAAAPLAAHWLAELTPAFFELRAPRQLVKAASDQSGMELMLGELGAPPRNWFGAEPAKARDRLLWNTFRAAVRKTQARLGNDPGKWRWGDLHHAEFHHPLAPLGEPYAGAFRIGPFPTEGGPHTPNLSMYDGGFARRNGPSYRQIFDLADWDRAVATSVPGQSGQPGSPHYADLAPLWANGKYFPLAFSREKVREVTAHRLVLRPAQGRVAGARRLAIEIEWSYRNLTGNK